MKYIEVQSSEFKDVPIVDFISRVKANSAKQERKIENADMNKEGNDASGKTKNRNRKSDPL
jgi:hypothetical protein